MFDKDIQSSYGGGLNSFSWNFYETNGDYVSLISLYDWVDGEVSLQLQKSNTPINLLTKPIIIYDSGQKTYSSVNEFITFVAQSIEGSVQQQSSEKFRLGKFLGVSVHDSVQGQQSLVFHVFHRGRCIDLSISLEEVIRLLGKFEKNIDIKTYPLEDINIKGVFRP